MIRTDRVKGCLRLVAITALLGFQMPSRAATPIITIPVVIKLMVMVKRPSQTLDAGIRHFRWVLSARFAPTKCFYSMPATVIYVHDTPKVARFPNGVFVSKSTIFVNYLRGDRRRPLKTPIYEARVSVSRCYRSIHPYNYS